MSKIYVVGIGPGSMEDMTPRAKKAMEESDIIIGYSAYIELVKEYFPGKSFVSSSMTREVERCKLVLDEALGGKTVSLISSGESGIYGMAGIMLEVVNKSGKDVPVEIIPGITAAFGAAAILGAPIMHDFSVISLSDLLTPWDLICKRVECASQGDFVICLYNPKSRKRSDYINIARDIMLKYKDKKTPVGIVRNVGREEESYAISTLEDMLQCEIDMFTVILVGNSKTYVENGKMITPRGYNI